MDKGLSAYSSTALIVVLFASLLLCGNFDNPIAEDAEKIIEEEIKILEQKDLKEDSQKKTQEEASEEITEKNQKEQPCLKKDRK